MRGRRVIWVSAIALMVVLLAGIYFFIDPVEVKWMPRCIWKVATGTDCPGCGSQRMAHALMHGDIAGAWKANAYALCMLPAVGLLLWLELFRERYPGMYRIIHSPAVIWVLTASVVVWWIARNVF